ncbi:hypothetical protein SSX86_023478 [Deinandra increscens subsp. villosa]|uniref:Uncharacterized protein n=1 Tax=Deinandra increscens subsp. villosa TaxID=3103831 RepID=A0AAP0GR90_9ASTR
MLSAGLPLVGGDHLFLHRNNPILLSRPYRPIATSSFTFRSLSSSLKQLDTSSSSSTSAADDDDRKLSSTLSGSASFPPVKVAKRVVLVRHG